MHGSLLSVSATIVWWIALVTCFTGCGLLLRRRFHLGTLDFAELWMAFWSGWAAVIGLLQIWQLFWPIDLAALLAVGVLGSLGCLLEHRALSRLVLQVSLRLAGPAALAIVLLGTAAILSNGPIRNYDVGLYYLQTVDWLTHYPIVRGLANLHGRLAFNSSYFLFAALTDVGPLHGRAINLTNGVLITALMAQALGGAAALQHSTRLWRFHYWSLLCLIPAAIVIAGSRFSDGRASSYISLVGFAPDVGIAVIGLVLTGFSIVLVYSSDELTPGQRSYLWLVVFLLTYVGVAVKLSFAAFAATQLAVLAMTERSRRARPGFRAWKPLCGPLALGGLAIGGTWIWRSILLSGYPFYPSTLGAAPVPWRVPRALVLSEHFWIQSWAQAPNRHWAMVLGNTEWLRSWVQRLPLDLAIFTSALAVGFVAALALMAAGKLSSHELVLGLGLVAPALVSIVVWFVTAPDPRFTVGSFWILALSGVLVATSPFAGQAVQRRRSRLLVGATVAGLILTVPAPSTATLLDNLNHDTTANMLPAPSLVGETTTSGLAVNIPAGDDRCWDAALPCTPYFRPGLRLASPNRLADGFILNGPREFVDIHSNTLPPAFSAPADVGVELVGDWYPYDDTSGQYWMGERGRILMYTERPHRTTLTLIPGRMHDGSGLGTEGRLQVEVGSYTSFVTLRTDQAASVDLDLRAGFTIVELRLEEGVFVPAEALAGDGDTRALSLAIRSFAIDQ